MQGDKVPLALKSETSLDMTSTTKSISEIMSPFEFQTRPDASINYNIKQNET